MFLVPISIDTPDTNTRVNQEPGSFPVSGNDLIYIVPFDFIDSHKNLKVLTCPKLRSHSSDAINVEKISKQCFTISFGETLSK